MKNILKASLHLLIRQAEKIIIGVDTVEGKCVIVINSTVKMMVVVTNLGNISYLVKKENYNRQKAVEIYNHAVSEYNEGSNIHDYQKAAFCFLSNCHEANIVYEDR